MTPPSRTRRRTDLGADSLRRYLDLTRLLDDVERRHPEISAPLRVTLVRAYRDQQICWIDEARFRSVVEDLLIHAHTQLPCPAPAA